MEGVFLQLLRQRLSDLENQSIEDAVRCLPRKAYLRTCGRVEAIREIRDALIPEIIKSMQKDDD